MHSASATDGSASDHCPACKRAAITSKRDVSRLFSQRRSPRSSSSLGLVPRSGDVVGRSRRPPPVPLGNPSDRPPRRRSPHRCASIDIAGNVTGTGAGVSLQTVNTADGQLHNITVDAGAVIDVSGSWINDSPSVTLQPGTAPTVINGGNVSIGAAGNLALAAHTLIDVSGGGWVNQSNQLAVGAAGQISRGGRGACRRKQAEQDNAGCSS